MYNNSDGWLFGRKANGIAKYERELLANTFYYAHPPPVNFRDSKSLGAFAFETEQFF